MRLRAAILFLGHTNWMANRDLLVGFPFLRLFRRFGLKFRHGREAVWAVAVWASLFRTLLVVAHLQVFPSGSFVAWSCACLLHLR